MVGCVVFSLRELYDERLSVRKSVINIIPYIEGTNIITEGSFESMQTFFAVVSKRLDKIFTCVSIKNWKFNQYKHMICDIFGENPRSQLMLLSYYSIHSLGQQCTNLYNLTNECLIKLLT